MAVTYIETSFGTSQTFKVPQLHKVVYAHTFEGVPAMWQVSYKDYLVNEWLKDNCKHAYYHSGGWDREKSIQFECDEEAMMFALRWA